MHSHLLMFPWVRISMMVQHSGVVLPATGFWAPPFTVASRLVYPHNMEDKTPSLMLKQLSTARNTQKVSQLYSEEKREERKRGNQEEKREHQKRREQSSP